MKNNLHTKLIASAFTAFSVLGMSDAVNAQWTLVDTAGFSPAGLSNWQHLIFDANNTPYVSFNDEGQPAGEGTVMKFDGTHWISVGTPGFTAGIAHHSSFALGSNGRVYFSYADGNNVSKAAVMMYDGTSWASIGDNLSVGECQYSNMKVINDTAYLCFVDNGAGGVLTALKYNGTAWVPVGSTAQITTGATSYASMTTDMHDTLYIAYQDQASGSFVSVKKFDGTNWVAVGVPFLSQPFGGAYDVSLAFDHNNVPYVAYWNPAPMGPSASVQKYNAATNAWDNVGTPSFTTTIVTFTSLAIDANNVPYLAFQDGSMNGQKCSVMKFDGTNWNYLGAAGFSADVSAYNSLALDANGNPYVAYFDQGNNNKTTVMKYTVCNAPGTAAVSANDSTICTGDTAILTATGTLNDATNWYWYTGGCGGALVDSGASIHVAPGDTTTYYVQGFGGCVVSGTCTPLTIDATNVPVPTISTSGVTLTASSTTGNQWNLSGTAISGATGHTYTVIQTGWYTVTVTEGNCSSTSDSVLVTVPNSVPGLFALNSVEIFPIPFNNVLNIAISTSAKNTQDWQVSVTDNTGRIVYSQMGLKVQNELQLTELAIGMYFITIKTPEASKVFKVMKD